MTKKSKPLIGPGMYSKTKLKKKVKKRRVTQPGRDPDLTPVNLHTFDLVMEKLTQMNRDGELAAVVLVGIPKVGKPVGGARVIDSGNKIGDLMVKIDDATAMIKEGYGLGDEFSFVFDD